MSLPLLFICNVIATTTDHHTAANMISIPSRSPTNVVVLEIETMMNATGKKEKLIKTIDF